MKVLVDCRSIRPGRSGGIENFAYSAIEGLERYGASVTLDVYGPDREWYEQRFSQLSGIQCIADPLIESVAARLSRNRLGRGLFGGILRSARKVGADFDVRRRRWAQQQKADVVFYPFHLDPPQHDIPMVTTVHAILPEYKNGELSVIASHVGSARAVTVSWPHPFKELTERYSEYAEKFFMIPFTVAQNVEGVGRRDDLHLEMPQRFLFYPAVINERKNHRNLIKAYHLMRLTGRELPPVVCVGGGDGLLRNRLIEMASSLGVGDKFIFLGYLPKEAMVLLYRECLGTVSASLWEAGMATLQEGGFCGKPAACSDIGPARAHANLLNFEVCFFDPRNPSDIGAKLVEFVANISAYRHSAEEASHLVRAMNHQYVGKCYGEVLAYAAGRAPRPTWAPFRRPEGVRSERH